MCGLTLSQVVVSIASPLQMTIALLPRWGTFSCLVAVGLAATAPIALSAVPDVISKGPVSFLNGEDKIAPNEGTPGSGTEFNFLFYLTPGEGENTESKDPSKQLLPHEPFFIAYEHNAGPVQTNDWWTGVGLQWYVPSTGFGWAFSWGDGIVRSSGFISEPFFYQFVDFTGATNSAQPPLPPPHGLRLWNQNAVAVKIDGKEKPTDQFDTRFNIVDRASIQTETQAVVTVGLEGVHPLRKGNRTEPPTAKPWTNVRVRKYSDWGVVLAYGDGSKEMEITMVNGSPFTWFERTKGQEPFLVWAGGPAIASDVLTVWRNDNGVLGVTVKTPFIPDNGIPPTESTAAYVIITDQGAWTEARASNDAQQSMFKNSTATRLVVLAMPHNVPLDNDNALRAAAAQLVPSACRKIAETRVDYPPISGSKESTTLGGHELRLGYSPTDNRVALQLRVSTEAFLTGACVMADPIQLLFPHHVKSLPEAQRTQVDERYTWNTIMGPLRLYRGSSFVQVIDTKGFLPFLPSQAVDTSQKAVEDIYETMRNWFYLEEFQINGGHINSFVRDIGTYDNAQNFSYEPGLATLIESLTIADQLAQSKLLTGDDTSTNKLGACLCKPRKQVAAEMRDYILQALEELVGQWADVYTTQLIQYNPKFCTTYGFPPGHKSCQDLNDHHFIFGYFLRAAAAIGRYDPEWLKTHLPFFDELGRDVANYNRADKNYPFLRNFSPFYGHSWANGTTDGNGENQESTSEAINFSAGLIELGFLLGKNDWRDLGMYMYEQEILAIEQYWFNQDAKLTNTIPPIPTDPNKITYNGNWPAHFVTFKGPDGKVWHSTLAGILHQRFVARKSFFGPIDTTYSIQMTPLSANTLYLGRNHSWLKATWEQYLLDTGAEKNPNIKADQENIIAAWQARMPASGSGINGTGLSAALERIAREHSFQQQATNTMAKHWAYTNALLGPVDTSIVANTPSYGVFNNGTQGYHLVAYNPSEQPISVKFTQRQTNSEVATLTVPGQSIVSKSSGSAPASVTFKPAHITMPAGRLYLGETKGTLPARGHLLPAPGIWLPKDETYPFPNNGAISKIMPSLTIVPVSTGNCGDLDIPGETGGEPCKNGNKAYVEWEGTFGGNLVSNKPFTQMAIYTNPALHPGWQQNPLIEANTHVRVEYYFDFTSNTPDRIEVYTLPSEKGNTFVIGKNKFTHYYFGCYHLQQANRDDCASGLYGLETGSPLKITLDDRPLPEHPPAAKPFPPNVTRGKIKVQVYGQAGPDQTKKAPVPVSVRTSPLLNRASWVQPPYDG